MENIATLSLTAKALFHQSDVAVILRLYTRVLYMHRACLILPSTIS